MESIVTTENSSLAQCMTRPFRISTGPSRLKTRISRKKVSWAKLVKRLQKFEQIDISYEEYLALPRDRQSDLKDVGYFIGGQFNGSGRILEEMARRCCITLDIDHIDWLDIDLIEESYADLEYVVHSTMKHSDNTPRLRLVFPLTKDITPNKYEPIARKLADRLGMECFDDTTFQPARIMFWPAVAMDGKIYKEHNKGAYVDPDQYLERYDDWTDFGEWPHSSRVDRPRGSVKQAEWPLDKPGIIGAFCRTFDIHSAIARFELPYESTDFDNRYLPVGASGAAGAVVYDDVFLYSNHESDVVGLQNVNAWDLVRAHRFGDLDANIDDDVPMMQRPSSKEMTSLALNIPEIHTELANEELRDPNGEDRSADRLKGKPSSEAGSGKSTLTYEDISKSIATLKPEDKSAIDVVLNKMTAARLDPFELDQLAGQLKINAKIPKSVTTKAVETRAKKAGKRTDTSGDIERNVIQYLLDARFAGGKHIKRFAKMYWTYERGLWAVDSDERIDGVLANSVFELREERPADVMALVAAIDDKSTSAWLMSLARVMKGTLAEREDRVDPLRLMRRYPLPFINTLNCELVFNRKGQKKVRDHDPDNFYTVRVDTDYQPKAKCPEWNRFCAMIFANSSDPEDMQRHLEELCGYIIGSSRWLKTWVLFHGSKDTGKSTVAQVLQRMLGHSYLGYDLNRFEQRRSNQFTENALVGKLVVVDDDYEKINRLPDGFLKKISEEKALSTEKKGGEVFDFVCRALPIICSNHWPKSSDLSDAIRERALVFPFEHKIAGHERDDERRDLMLKELPGILNNFISGLKRLRKRGEWDIPLDCTDARKMWEGHANIVAAFQKQYLKPGDDDAVPLDVWNAFQPWASENIGIHHKQQIPGKIGFYDQIDALIGSRVTGHAGKELWRGFVLRDPRMDELRVDDDEDF
jgi:P4 family phage/plasmid primase-like protien